MSELARRYAQALHDVFSDEIALRRSADKLMGDRILWEALCSPAIQPWEKEHVLKRLSTLRGCGSLLRFYCLLAQKGRMSLLPDIVKAFEEISLEAQGAARCSLVCAHAPEITQLDRLREALCRLHHKRNIRFDIRIDPKLLGGFILTLEGITYDKSVRGALEGLARKLEERKAV